MTSSSRIYSNCLCFCGARARRFTVKPCFQGSQYKKPDFYRQFLGHISLPSIAVAYVFSRCSFRRGYKNAISLLTLSLWCLVVLLTGKV